MSASATPAPPALTDAVILGKLDAANVNDSAAGSLAASKGTNASVNEFGRMMVKDHHAMRVEGMAVANKAGVKAEMPHDADALAEKALADRLSSESRGAAWDKAFIDHAIDAHTRVLLFAQDAANATQNADLKSLIQKAAPTVQKHLEAAQDIRGRLAATP